MPVLRTKNKKRNLTKGGEVQQRKNGQRKKLECF